MKNKRTTKGYSITVPPDFVPQIKLMADANRRSISNYISWLVERDVRELRFSNKKI